MLNAKITNPKSIPHKIKKNIDNNSPILKDNKAKGKK